MKNILLLILLLIINVFANTESVNDKNVYIVYHDINSTTKKNHIYQLVEVQRKIEDLSKKLENLKNSDIKNVKMHEESLNTLQKTLEINQESFYSHMNQLYWVAWIAIAIIIAIATATGLMYRREFKDVRKEVKDYIEDEKKQHIELRTQMKNIQEEKLKDLKEIVNAYIPQMENAITKNIQLNDSVNHTLKHFSEIAGKYEVDYDALQNNLQTEVEKEFLRLLLVEGGCDQLQSFIEKLRGCICIEDSKDSSPKNVDDNTPEFQ